MINNFLKNQSMNQHEAIDEPTFYNDETALKLK